MANYNYLYFGDSIKILFENSYKILHFHVSLANVRLWVKEQMCLCVCVCVCL